MLTLLFTITYMVSYITRINYGAIISEMEQATDFSKSLLSMSITGSFITYGAGQIISGILGDRFSPKKLVSTGLVTTVLMNLLIPLCKTPYQMLVVWCINGFTQSFMWPPLVRIMTTLFSEEDYKKAAVKVSCGSSLGTIAVYLLSPMLIMLSGWKAVFIFSAVCGFIMIIVWNIFCQDVPKSPRREVEVSPKKGKFFTPLILCIMVAIILQGMLRDGVTTWMPSYISETYSISNIIAILTGVALPLFGILCFQLASVLYRKKFTNPLLCAGILFGAGTLSALGLFILPDWNAAFSVLLSATLTGCMHGVNLILICMIPPYFKKQGNVSTVSGILNSCTYIGSALSAYGIGLLSETMGWNFTLMIWLMAALAGTVICLACVKPWSRI